ncbi:VOC family protein [Rhizobiaceae bacterium n13]|uniref:VOC family protein n=1 Tax=Ferirhizobium litorale TaxID=2927786 RepID=A0AAE3U1Z3_9HYPH|nr:VOC family protein [Fererhizobium litorale]MDI7863275.1 VOC family protein [Fererhizobium litorale]MDI7922991.1 VOC family protein [Fererhizobium litorale]
MFDRIHHIAIICGDYARSKAFYCDILGFGVLAENWREASRSWKCDLKNGSVQIELFHFADAPPRPTRPEARGLRHLAFAVADLDGAVRHLNACGIDVEDIRIDPYTEKRFTFFADPDGLPIELYEDR